MLMADFNCQIKPGVVATTVPFASPHRPKVGDDVLVGDYEGNCCRGLVLARTDYRLGHRHPPPSSCHVRLDWSTWHDAEDWG